MSKGILYLLPVTLGDEADPAEVLPAPVIAVLHALDEFIVEDEKSARRFLKRAGYPKPLQELKLHSIGKHTREEEMRNYLDSAANGQSIGLLSEAGCPGIADPGANIVAMAHRRNIRVQPMTGPSSILLALMASGLNGQNFAFHGYLPIDKNDRGERIKFLAQQARRFQQTQIFIEAPFRNDQLLADLLRHADGNARLCIACDLTLPTETIRTQSISEWKKNPPSLHKRPAVFLLL
jgi:16S rRNA (cytidine1402-2'-O)-methyltransferase